MKKSLIISILIIIIPISVFARYKEEIAKVKTNGIIAEPIVRIEELSEHQVSKMNKNSVKEYKFKVCNYYDYKETLRISEVNFKYNIEVISTNANFPVKYELYDSDNTELLTGKNITSDFIIHRNGVYEKEYKLIVYWEDKEEPANDTDIKIRINAFQI